MAKSPRPFDPKALRRYAVAAIRPRLGPTTLVHRYTMLVSVEQIKAGDFLALQQELADALVEGLILVKRMDVTIL
jgi:hypothetical protein